MTNSLEHKKLRLRKPVRNIKIEKPMRHVLEDQKVRGNLFSEQNLEHAERIVMKRVVFGDEEVDFGVLADQLAGCLDRTKVRKCRT